MALHADLLPLFPPGETSVIPTPLAPALPMMREQMRAVGRAFTRPTTVTARDVDLGVCPGRLYRPDAESGETLLVFLHGGGFVLGDLETHDAMCARLAQVTGCAVLAVAYRLAPEHRFPAGLDDCDAAYRWAVDHAASLGLDPAKVAVGGESAGANLAAAVTLRRRARGDPQPAFQLLIHPLTDFRFGVASIESVEGPGITRAFMNQVRDMYLGEGGHVDDSDASPLLASSHTGLAPAVVITAECDPIRDDGEAYALALATSGVETLLQRLPGLPHGFLFLPAELPSVSAAYDLLGSLIRRYAQR